MMHMRATMIPLLLLLSAAPAFAQPKSDVKPVLSQALPNVPGQTMTAVLVSYPPGGKSGAHRHAGSVFAYVVSGHIRSQVSTLGPVTVYGPGESFFEAPGATHLISENASDSEPASLLAVFVAPDGATLTIPAK
jgi:quercetin dioxygenase-like cupin family protein